jgi:hypothetical protein
MMKRRAFITLLGGAAAAWPFAGRAQQGERVLRIGVLMNVAADDPEAQARKVAFQQGLAALGWIDGRNVLIDTRWATTNADDIRRHAAELAAPSLGMEASPVNVRDVGEIERNIAALAHSSNGGVVVTASPEASRHRDLITTLAARHRLPAVYPSRYYATGGGLISYGPDSIDPYRRAASYVDRILKGAKPGDLPVQTPTKIELAVNLKTAKALGLEVPPTLLARADEVIE